MASSQLTTKSTKVRDSAELQKLCEQWQTVLRLRDWHIEARFANSADMSGHNRGECHANMHHKTATILLLPPEGSDAPTEKTLLHELLHVHLNTLDVPSERSAEEEVVINLISGALYECAQAIRTALQRVPKKKGRRKSQDSPRPQK